VQCNVLEGIKKVGDTEEIILETVVADTGCGIPTSKLQMIFREFEQVESSESRSSGETSVGKTSYRWVSLDHSFIHP
jgi:signal transduction histidine kinase